MGATSSDSGRLCPLLTETVRFVSRRLGLETAFADSRDVGVRAADGDDGCADLPRATARIVRLCRALGAATYVNPSRGARLYDPADFDRHGVRLEFLPMTRSANLRLILDLCLGDGLTRL